MNLRPRPLPADERRAATVEAVVELAAEQNPGDITTAAIAHLAHSTPEAYRFTSTDFNSYVTVSTAENAPQRVNGYMSAGTAPGLGIRPRLDVLGRRVVEVA